MLTVAFKRLPSAHPTALFLLIHYVLTPTVCHISLCYRCFTVMVCTTVLRHAITIRAFCNLVPQFVPIKKWAPTYPLSFSAEFPDVQLPGRTGALHLACLRHFDDRMPWLTALCASRRQPCSGTLTVAPILTTSSYATAP
jgi:hypothetical protein